MSTQIITLIIVSCVAALVIMTRLLIKEEDLIKKAQKNWFYHVLAKISSAKYDGYVMGEDEQKAIYEFASKPSEYDTHPIGSYLKLCESLKSTLSTCANFHNYKLNFNMSEVGFGVCVMLVFVGIVTLGYIYC